MVKPEWARGNLPSGQGNPLFHFRSEGTSDAETHFARIRQFLSSEDGPTAVEYAVMLALILVACITIVQTLGTSVSGTFSTVNASAS